MHLRKVFLPKDSTTLFDVLLSSMIFFIAIHSLDELLITFFKQFFSFLTHKLYGKIINKATRLSVNHFKL
jgi:hypothetical protein